MASLEIIAGNEVGHRYTLEDETIIGRHDDCDVVVARKLVSRTHTRVLRIGEQFYVEDLQSLNGTLLNGQRITCRVPLGDGDQIRIHETCFLFTTSDQLLGRDRPSGIIESLKVSSDSVISLAMHPKAKLEAMIDISRNLGRLLSVDAMIEGLLETAFKVFPQTERGCILMPSAADGKLEIRFSRMPGKDRSVAAAAFSRTIVNHAMSRGVALLSADALTDDRFNNSESIVNMKIRSMICAPILGAEGQPLGVIHLDTQTGHRQFTSDDLELLSGVAAIAGHAAENSKVSSDRQQLEIHSHELEHARDVQQQFLPARAPDVEEYDFFYFYNAAQHVGGDYFDFVSLPDQRLAVVVGDVCGKGLPAALFMARLSADVRFSLATCRDPAAAVFKVNNLMFAESEFDGRFVTLALGIIDLTTHEFTFVTAGHMCPFIRRAVSGAVERIGDGRFGAALGVDTSWNYLESRTTLEPGDTVVMYTDGVNEARNPHGDLYGSKRIVAALAESTDGPSAGSTILDDVTRFADDTRQTDDMCLVCFSRARGPAASE